MNFKINNLEMTTMSSVGTHKNIMPIFRPLFQEAFDKFLDILDVGEPGDKLVQAFCGVGKSRFAMRCLLEAKNRGKRLQVMVMPSIALMSQFNDDYISKYDGFETMSICCKDDTEAQNVNFTTEKETICELLRRNRSKIILCTYQSLHTLVECLEETNKLVDVAMFDEAHHSE